MDLKDVLLRNKHIYEFLLREWRSHNRALIQAAKEGQKRKRGIKKIHHQKSRRNRGKNPQKKKKFELTV